MGSYIKQLIDTINHKLRDTNNELIENERDEIREKKIRLGLEDKVPSFSFNQKFGHTSSRERKF